MTADWPVIAEQDDESTKLKKAIDVAESSKAGPSKESRPQEAAKSKTKGRGKQ
jgi:hypothetical protein